MHKWRHNSIKNSYEDGFDRTIQTWDNIEGERRYSYYEIKKIQGLIKEIN